MPTKDTKIITLRVPNRVNFGDVNLHKFITNLYDMVNIGAIEIVNNELVMPEGNCEECPARIVHEKVKEVCHDRNMSENQFFQAVRR